MSFSSEDRFVDLRLSTSRPGVMVAARLSGGVDVYDLFRDAGAPVLSTQLFSTSDCSCLDLDSTSRYIIVGTQDGLVALAALSQGLVAN